MMVEGLTPAMKQYQEFKERYRDSILFFHIGDFYETFGSDAETVSKELDIALTSRSKDSNGSRIPLAGVPYHAADSYIAKLVKKGYKVALCDQVEDPRKAKGIVKREVVRVITPGTIIDSSLLTSATANYLMSLCQDEKGEKFGISFLDISTGEFLTSEIESGEGHNSLLSEIARLKPAEYIVSSRVPEILVSRLKDAGMTGNIYRDDVFDVANARKALIGHFGVATLEGYGCESMPLAISAAGAAVCYALETQKTSLSHIRGLSTYQNSKYLILDAITLRNLEILKSIRGDSEDSTLVGVLDMTETPMGSRLIRKFITSPLVSALEINSRLDTVEFFFKNTPIRAELRGILHRFADIERIAGRIAYGNASPRDFVSLRFSLLKIPEIRAVLTTSVGDTYPNLFKNMLSELKELNEVVDLIGRAIVEEPPVSARDSGVIKAGYDSRLDELRGISASGKQWIAELQQRERDKTGIKSLKIGYNQVFGYYIEVTKPNLHLVPQYYERKQTTSSAERYTIPELREKEAFVYSADEKRSALEFELFLGVVQSIFKYLDELQMTAKSIASLDVYVSLAEVAVRNNYVRPRVDESDRIIIRDGRHPIVERKVQGGFVPNDTLLDLCENQMLIITGANMAGKSTYMRQVALICIMAQMGSFVPASYASIGIVDRIFTRVGAFDDLASGQSTFMVEMIELANILNNVSSKSLVILDEIGRGTSTLDGYSIAKAVLEYLHGKSKPVARTLFATHFHQLTEVETELKRVKNYHFAVKDDGKDIVFLRKVILGATDKSYGLHVARLAGIPGRIVDRGEEILRDIETRQYGTMEKVPRFTQMLFLDPAGTDKDRTNPVLEELEKLELDKMPPITALNTLYNLQKLAKNGRVEK